MFVPIGDDVNKRHFPAVGAVLIGICWVVFMYQSRLWRDSEPQVMPYMEKYLESGGSAEAQKALEQAFYRTEYWHFTLKWGTSPKVLKKGHVMSLVTHQFMHGDFLHLFGNMLMLWAFVGTLENTLGPVRFFSLYILWGLCAGAAHLAMNWHLNELPLIGASGAISGMIGAYLVAFGATTKVRCLIWLIVPLYKFSMPAGAFVVLWLLSQLGGIADDEKYGTSSIAWYAHLGGFAAGALTMLALRDQVLGRLARDKRGELIITEDPDEAAPKEQKEALNYQPNLQPGAAATAIAPVVASHPTTCPHCRGEISEEDRIHPSLFRCPKAGCQKLIFHQ